MLSLKDREWETFKVGELFDVGTGGLIDRKLLFEGMVPRISAKGGVNGVDGFYAPVKSSSYREFSNFISVSFLGSAFYHPYAASLDMKIHALKLKHHTLNRQIALFVIKMLVGATEKFSYGNQLSSSVLPRQILSLPITDDNAPDWQFMEDYIREREQMQLAWYFAYAERLLENKR